MLIIMLGSGQGLQNGVTRSFGGSATNAVYMWAQQTTIPYKGLPRGRSYHFQEDDIQAIKDNVPELDVLAPSAQLGGYRGDNNVSRGTKTGPFAVRGDFPENRFIQIFKMTSGRYLNALDIKEKRKVCVIAQRVLEILFNKGENPLGQYIQVNGTYFRVIGTLTSEKSGDDVEEKMQTIYIPFTTFQQAFNWGGRIGWFSLTAKPQYAASLVEEKIKKVLAQRHKISPDDPYAIGSWNSEKEFSKIQGLFSGISLLVWVVGIGTLLAGVIGVSNIMLIIVKERTREIGIRRAIGASPGSIMTQIISESILLTYMAGYFGMLAGVFLLEAINSAIAGQDTGMFYQPGVHLAVVLKALGILIFCGALAGIIPARKALAISTVDALRYE
jgi:putative ABC transport system permease protein